MQGARRLQAGLGPGWQWAQILSSLQVPSIAQQEHAHQMKVVLR